MLDGLDLLPLLTWATQTGGAAAVSHAVTRLLSRTKDHASTPEHRLAIERAQEGSATGRDLGALAAAVAALAESDGETRRLLGEIASSAPPELRQALEGDFSFNEASQSFNQNSFNRTIENSFNVGVTTSPLVELSLQPPPASLAPGEPARVVVQVWSRDGRSRRVSVRMRGPLAQFVPSPTREVFLEADGAGNAEAETSFTIVTKETSPSAPSVQAIVHATPADNPERGNSATADVLIAEVPALGVTFDIPPEAAWPPAITAQVSNRGNTSLDLEVDASSPPVKATTTLNQLRLHPEHDVSIGLRVDKHARPWFRRGSKHVTLSLRDKGRRLQWSQATEVTLPPRMSSWVSVPGAAALAVLVFLTGQSLASLWFSPDKASRVTVVNPSGRAGNGPSGDAGPRTAPTESSEPSPDEATTDQEPIPPVACPSVAHDVDPVPEEPSADPRAYTWAFPTGGPVYDGVLYDNSDDRLYVGSDDGRVYALDLDGRPIWSSACLDGPVAAQPSVRDDHTKVYAVTDTGTLSTFPLPAHGTDEVPEKKRLSARAVLKPTISTAGVLLALKGRDPDEGSIVNDTTGATYPTDSQPRQRPASYEGELLYVPEGGPTITVLDAHTLDPVRSLAVDEPEDLKLDYVRVVTEEALSYVGLSKGSVLGAGEQAGKPVLVWWEDMSQPGQVIPLEGGTRVTSRPTLAGTQAYVVVGDGEKNSVVTVDLTSERTSTTVELPGRDPDPSEVVVVQEERVLVSHDTCVYDVTDGQSRCVFRVSKGINGAPTVTEDGRTLFVGARDGRVYRVDDWDQGHGA